MSSQHDDYVAYHNTVNAQNRSNYEVKYRLNRANTCSYYCHI